MLLQERNTLATGRDADGSVTYADANISTECTALYRQFIAGVNANKKLSYTRQMHSNGIFDPSWYEVNSTEYTGVLSANVTIDGRVAIIANELSSGDLHYVMEVMGGESGTDGAADWTDPENLGLPSGVTEFKQVCLIRGYGDLDSVFGVTSAGELWWKTQNPYKIVEKTESVTPPGQTDPISITFEEQELPDEPWSEWMSLPHKVSRIYAAQNADGTIVLSGCDESSHNVFVSQQDIDNPQSADDWSSWSQISNIQAIFVRPILDREGFMNLLMVSYGDENYLYRVRQTEIGKNEYTAIKGLRTPSENIKHFACHADSNGLISVVMEGAEEHDQTSKLYSSLQTEDGEPTSSPDDQWTDWTYIDDADVPSGSLLSIDIMSDGRLNLYVWESEGSHDLRYYQQVSPGGTRWNNNVTGTKIGDDLKGIALTRDLTPDD